MADIKKELHDLKKKVEKIEKELSSIKKPKGERKKRPKTAYNIFISKELTKLKDEKPNITQAERMKIASARWQEQKK